MRNEQLSILKGLGIILVVLGHSGAPDLLTRFIYLFHMALFYYASGYFFREQSIHEKWRFTCKRIRGLYFPFVKWGLVFLLLHNVFYSLDIYNDEYGFKGITSTPYNWVESLRRFLSMLTFGSAEQLLGAYWFLESLFVVSLLFLWVFWLSDRCVFCRRSLLLGSSVCIIYLLGGGIAMSSLHLPRNLQREMIALLPFYMGYLSATSPVLNRFLARGRWSVLAICVLLLLFSTRLGYIDMVESEITNPLYCFFVAVLGCTACMHFSALLPCGRKLLSYIGEHTLVILTFHFLSFKAVSLLKIAFHGWDIARLAEFPVIESSNTCWWPLYTLFGVCLPLLLAYIGKKVKGRFLFLIRKE